MKKILSYMMAVMTASYVAHAATIALSYSSTQTIIAVSYKATTTAACTVTAVDNNGGMAASETTVKDLNASLFANANTDRGRTAANGFRWPTLCGTDFCSSTNTDVNRTVFIGGHDEIKTGANGKNYSTANQVASDFTITVSCNGGTDTGTIHATTQNIPLGLSTPEIPIPLAGAPLGVPQPTIDWGRTARGQEPYTDQITGALIKRVTGGDDMFETVGPCGALGSSCGPATYFSPVIDVNGLGQWTNAANFTTNQTSGTLASTNTVGAPLFAAFNVIPQTGDFITDFVVTPYGSGTGSAVAEFCLSTDSGQTCANYTPQDVNFSTTNQCQPTGTCSTSAVPGTVPSSNFSGWGNMKVAFGNYDLENLNSSRLNFSNGGGTVLAAASGNTVTIPSGIYPGFNLDRKPGSKFRLSLCGSGSPASFYTVAAVIDPSTIQTVETGLSLSGCIYQDLSVGLRVILKSGSNLNISFQVVGWGSRGFGNGSNGSYYPCARTKVTDIFTDCDGVTHTTPLSGFLCSAGGPNNSSVRTLLQDNGRICLQSNTYYNSGGHNIDGTPRQFLYTNANTQVAGGFSSYYKVQHIPNNYTEYPSDRNHTISDNYTYSTDVSATNPIGPQIAAAGGKVAAALATGLWPAMGIDQIFDDGNGGTVTQYRSTASNTGDALCMLAFANTANNNLISTLTTWADYPFTSASCHFPPDGGANYTKVGIEAENHQIAPWFTNTSVLLGGPFTSKITSIHQHDAVWKTWTMNVTAATAGSPVSISIPGNDLARIRGSSAMGVFMVCSGATSPWTGLNSAAGFYGHPQSDNTTITLYTDPQGTVPANFGSGTLTGTVTCVTAPPLYSISIGAVINNGGNARIQMASTPGYAAYFISGQWVVKDGDPIAISANYLNTTTQYYAKVTGAPAGDFDVYLNSALTTPATYASLSGAAGSFATYAEACPDPATVTLPGPMYTDTGFGTTGAGNQKIRCYIARLASEPESDFPASGEHTAYPPPPSSTEASNTQKSMLHQINVGDAFQDFTDFPGSNHEIGFVLAVDRSVSENQIDVTIMRQYGDDPNFGWRGYSNSLFGDTYAQQHPPGWAMWQVAAISGAAVSMTATPTFGVLNSGFSGHNDLVGGTIAGTLTIANPFQPTVVTDDAMDTTMTAASNITARTHNSIPVWNSAGGYQAASANPPQSYPSKRTVPGVALPSELGWKTDWMAMNPGFGNSQNNGDDIGWARSLTNIHCNSTYDAACASNTTNVWKIGVIGTVNIKLAPIIVQNLPHEYFADMSGPGVCVPGVSGNCITNANAGKYCRVDFNGECRPGSSAGDVFFVPTAGFFNWPSCRTNEATLGTPCAFGVWPGAGWAVQVRMTPIDTNGTGVRRITQGFWLPPNHYSFSNWVSTPDGKWGLFVSNPIQQRPRKGQMEGSHQFAVKLPPFPSTDSLQFSRSYYVPYKVNVPAGGSVRATWWYGENGQPGDRYCTTRLEACWTSSTATQSNPFVFASETQSKTICTSGCTLSIPAIPGRIMFYRIERTVGGVVSLGSVTSVAVN